MSKPYTLSGFTTRPGEKQLATMPELETPRDKDRYSTVQYSTLQYGTLPDL